MALTRCTCPRESVAIEMSSLTVIALIFGFSLFPLRFSAGFDNEALIALGASMVAIRVCDDG